MPDACHQPNFRSPAARMRQAEEVCRRWLADSPVAILVLSPDLTIVDANQAYLTSVSHSREALCGFEMFEVFPDSPHNPYVDSVRNLNKSFGNALQTGGHDVMRLQRYDIRPPGRPWEVRYWNPANWPVLDDAGSIIALVHHVSDVTSYVLASKGMIKPIRGTTDLLTRADAAIQATRETVKDVRHDLLIRRADTAGLRRATADPE